MIKWKEQNLCSKSSMNMICAEAAQRPIVFTAGGVGVGLLVVLADQLLTQKPSLQVMSFFEDFNHWTQKL